MSRFHEPLLPAKTYHLYNESVGNELLYRTEGDYIGFMNRVQKHISLIAEILAWSFTPHSFDLIIKVNDKCQLLKEYSRVKMKECSTDKILSEFIMERFSNCLNSYAKSYNNCYLRKGGLFINYSKRKEIENNTELIIKIAEIHRIPETLGYISDFRKWPYSSYRVFIESSKQTTNQEKIVAIFGGIENFKLTHTTILFDTNAIMKSETG